MFVWYRGNMSLHIDLGRRVALVTGGARGVGRGITRSLVEAGATVVTCSRSDVTPVEGTTHRVCDVRDPEAVADLVAGIVEAHGRLDVLVNNVGGAPVTPAATTSPRLHAKVIELNLFAPLLLSQAANAVMQGQPEGGAIVNISSVSALRPSPGSAAYSAAKAGLDALTRSLAVEWAPKVRVNAINVGPVRPDDPATVTDHYGGEAGIVAINATIPLGRMAEPRDVGRVALFLASPLADYVSGSTIALHGGGETPAFLTAQQNLAKEPTP
ncbi:SDR family oxidoreductase [Streptomyces chlorus]